MADDTLHIGDIICLFSTDSHGFVFSSQSSSVHNELAVGSKQDKHIPDVKDQKLLTFEICVANRYKLGQKCRKILSKIDDGSTDYSILGQLHQAQVAAKAETEDNEAEQKRQLGKKLLYGQIIQLKQNFTRKYIHVSTKSTSPTEGKNMAVVLHPFNAKHAQFKVMPRYKLKAEGDVVHMDDQILFESVKSGGHYLHVSKSLLGGLSAYHKSYELNLSVQQSGFTVFRKYKPSPDDVKKVKVGDIVRFYHKEMEAYLVAEGLFDYEVTEDVHLRLRPVVQCNPKSLLPSSAAITYWQIELQEGCVAGGVLKWEQQCRLLHMCTRKYLCLGKSGEVTLTSDHLDPKAVFRLHPVIKDGDDIPEDSYCRMEHVVSGQWLHASTDEYKRNQEKALKTDSKSMGSLKWSTATMKKISVVEEQQYDDAFTVQSVEPPLEHIFSFMAGMVPFIQKFVQDKKDGVVLNAKMSSNVITALKEISQFIVVDGEPVKQRQKLMRHLRIVELLVDLLKVQFSGPDQYHMIRVFRAVYDVLHTYLLGRSRKNKLYIAKYIDFFLTQFEIKEGNIGLSAVHMVMESIRDNRKIVDRITHDHINTFVQLLLADKNYRYLDLLSVLCVCSGVSIADNQNYITDVWLMQREDCVFLTNLGQYIGREKGKMYVSTNGGKTYIDIVTFANRDQESDEYLFLEHQLKLFGYLSRGQNTGAISAITEDKNYLTWDEAFTCLREEKLPEQLRAICCDLIITLFVDTPDNHSVVDRVKLCYVFDNIDNAEDSANLADNRQSKTYQYFPDISRWISAFLGRNMEMTASRIGNNILIKQVLRLVDCLVAFGFYGNYEDIKKLLDPLMSLLDGRYDKPYPNIQGKQGQEMLVVFRQSERFKPSPETKAIVEAKVQCLEVLDLFFNFRFNNRLEKFISLFKYTHQQVNKPGGSTDLAPLMNETFELEHNLGVAKKGKRKLAEIFDTTAFMRQYNIVDILLDLSHYEYDDIVRKSMHLLNRWFSAYQNLFKRAILTQVLITDESVKVYCRVEVLMPELRRLAAYRMGDNEANQMAKILQELVDLCHLDGEDEEPHVMNQSILYNSGIMEDVFTVLSKEIDEKILDHYAGLRKVFEKTFVLLKILARDNPVVQQRLFDRLDLLLAKKGGLTQMAEAVIEIFTGNSKTCMKITQQHVEKIMALVAVHKSAVPQFLGVLNTIVKINELDLPLKRNQSLVMTTFMQHSSEVAPVIHQDENARMKLLMSTDLQELDFFISVVDLLSTCSEGENRFIESICQTIFKIPELLRVLNNSNIGDNLKRPFLRFFQEVYVNTFEGMIDSGAGDIPHDRAMWEYITNLCGTLVTVTEYSKRNPQLVKQMLKKPPRKSSRAVDSSDRMHGSLHYLFGAVMAFIQVFCRSYYEVDIENYSEEPVKLTALAENFKDFLEEIAPLVSIEKQMQNLIACMSVLYSVNTLASEHMEKFQEQYGLGVSSQDVRSDARKAYEEYYRAEEDLNDKLGVFATNTKVAYGGTNDVQTQIGYSSKRPYSELGGDEELPLGEEFQDHIDIFIDHNGRTALEKYRLAEKLIRQLSISTTLAKLSEKARLEQLELDIKCLLLLRGIVHNEIVKLPETFDMWKCRRQLNTIEAVQNALNHYDTIHGTIEHLARPNDDIVRELLAFLVVLLFNGNKAVQASLHNFFTGTREETFFLAIKNRINLATLATRERRVLETMRHAKIEEVIAQAKALRKAMKNGPLASIAVASLTRTLMTSMASMRRSVASLGMLAGDMHAGMRMAGSRLGSTIAMDSQTSQNNGKYKDSSRQTVMWQQGPSNTTWGHEPPIGHILAQHAHIEGLLLNGAEKLAMKTSRTSVGGLSMTGNNRVEPAVTIKDVDAEIVEEDDFKQLLEAANMPGFEIKNDGCIELVLRILGLMCDNEHTGLQNYLREQPDNIKSVNLAAETIQFLNTIYSNINDKSIILITDIFETLVEFTSGNSTNQAVVFDLKICDYVNHILRVGVYKDCHDREVYSLKRAIGNLLRCLTEQNPVSDADQQANLPKAVMESLDTDILVTVMIESRKASETRRNDEDMNMLLQSVGFQYYYLVARTLDLDPSFNQELILKTEDQIAAFDYYVSNTLSIEIIKEDVIQKLCFRVRDKNVLREEIKEKFKYEIDRSSPSNKIREFMDWTRDIIKDIKYQRRVHANPVGRILVNSWLRLNYLVMLVTLVIAIFVIVSWEEGDANSPRYKPAYRFQNAHVAIYVLGGIHNFLSLGIFFSYIISNRPRFPSFRDIYQRGENDIDEQENWLDKKEKSHLEVRAFSFKTIYYVLFLGCSAAGTFTDGYFFAFHLLHISELNQLLKRVIQAVTTNGKSLMLVALLGMAIFYIYSLILFAFYREWMWSANDGRHCRNIYECFVSIIHHGLSDGPYTQFQGQMGSSFAQAIGITFFDVSFFILITTIGLNIIFGIIVDTFSQLRDSKVEIDKDMKSTCFICSREGYDFEKYGGGEGFNRHTRKEHYQWAYLFFFLHLDETRPNDYSALELYVHKLLKIRNYDFFPLGRALSLEKVEDTKEVKLDNLQLQVNFIVAKLKEQEADLLREKEKQRQQDWEKTHKKK